jgi:enoyl-CoA hydratase/carnithine racemase
MIEDYKQIIYDLSDNIATITFNRPDQMNTFSIPLMLELFSAIERCDEDDAVRVIIITGAGRAFCAGADLSGGAKTFDYAKQGEIRDKLKVNGLYRDWGGWLSLRLFQCKKPIIAAVNGAAAGVGATLQCAMDIRLASNKAKFVFPFTRRGIVPESAATWFLPRIVSISTALEWALTGRQIPALEAKERGLVRSVHEPEDLLPAARALAKEIVDNTAPVSVAATRLMMWRMLGAAHPMEAHRVDSRGVQKRGASSDAKEGIESFLAKRLPHFTDKVSDGIPDIFPDWEEPEFY